MVFQTPVHSRASMGINSPSHQSVCFFFFFPLWIILVSWYWGTSTVFPGYSLSPVDVCLSYFYLSYFLTDLISWLAFCCWAAASLLLCLRKQMLCHVPLVPQGMLFHFTINAKKMARDGRNIQRTEHLETLAALPAAVYPPVLGLLKTAFPAHYRKARTAVRMRVPSQRLLLEQYSASGLICRREAWLCVYFPYTVITQVN